MGCNLKHKGISNVEHVLLELACEIEDCIKLSILLPLLFVESHQFFSIRVLSHSSRYIFFAPMENYVSFHTHITQQSFYILFQGLKWVCLPFSNMYICKGPYHQKNESDVSGFFLLMGNQNILLLNFAEHKLDKSIFLKKPTPKISLKHILFLPHLVPVALKISLCL